MTSGLNCALFYLSRTEFTQVSFHVTFYEINVNLHETSLRKVVMLAMDLQHFCSCTFHGFAYKKCGEWKINTIKDRHLKKN